MCEGGGLLLEKNNNLFRPGTPNGLVGRKLQSPLKRSRTSDSSGITDEELRSIESPKLKKQKSVENKLDSPRSILELSSQSQEIKSHSLLLSTNEIPLIQNTNSTKKEAQNSHYNETKKTQKNDQNIEELDFEDCFEPGEDSHERTSNLDISFTEENLNDTPKKSIKKKEAPTDILLNMVLKEESNVDFELNNITSQINGLIITQSSAFTRVLHSHTDIPQKTNLNQKRSLLFEAFKKQETKTNEFKNRLMHFAPLFFTLSPENCEQQLNEINKFISNENNKEELNQLFKETMHIHATTNFEKILNTSQNNSNKTIEYENNESQSKKFYQLKTQCKILDRVLNSDTSLFDTVSSLIIEKKLNELPIKKAFTDPIIFIRQAQQLTSAYKASPNYEEILSLKSKKILEEALLPYLDKSFNDIFETSIDLWEKDLIKLGINVDYIGRTLLDLVINKQKFKNDPMYKKSFSINEGEIYKHFLKNISNQINILISQYLEINTTNQEKILKLKRISTKLFSNINMSDYFGFNVSDYSENYTKKINKNIDNLRFNILKSTDDLNLKKSVEFFKRFCSTKHQKKYEDLLDQLQSNYEKKLFRHLQKKQHTFYTIINGENKVSMRGRQLISNVLFQFRKEFDALINDETVSENQFMYHEDLFETYQCKSYELKSFLQILRSRSINPANEMTLSSSKKKRPLLFIEKTTQTICKDIIDLLAKMDISAPETINQLGINPQTFTFNELNHTTIDGEVASVLTEETIKKCSSFQKDILTLYFKISEFENQCECFIRDESKELVNRIKFIKSLLTNLMETNSKEVVRKKRNLLKFIPLHLTKK